MHTQPHIRALQKPDELNKHDLAALTRIEPLYPESTACRRNA